MPPKKNNYSDDGKAVLAALAAALPNWSDKAPAKTAWSPAVPYARLASIWNASGGEEDVLADALEEVSGKGGSVKGSKVTGFSYNTSSSSTIPDEVLAPKLAAAAAVASADYGEALARALDGKARLIAAMGDEEEIESAKALIADSKWTLTAGVYVRLICPATADAAFLSSICDPRLTSVLDWPTVWKLVSTALNNGADKALSEQYSTQAAVLARAGAFSGVSLPLSRQVCEMMGPAAAHIAPVLAPDLYSSSTKLDEKDETAAMTTAMLLQGGFMDFSPVYQWKPEGMENTLLVGPGKMAVAPADWTESAVPLSSSVLGTAANPANLNWFKSPWPEHPNIAVGLAKTGYQYSFGVITASGKTSVIHCKPTKLKEDRTSTDYKSFWLENGSLAYLCEESAQWDHWCGMSRTKKSAARVRLFILAPGAQKWKVEADERMDTEGYGFERVRSQEDQDTTLAWSLGYGDEGDLEVSLPAPKVKDKDKFPKLEHLERVDLTEMKLMTVKGQLLKKDRVGTVCLKVKGGVRKLSGETLVEEIRRRAEAEQLALQQKQEAEFQAMMRQGNRGRRGGGRWGGRGFYW